MPGKPTDEINAALDRAGAATKVTVVLFAALIQSWLLLHNDSGKYSITIAERLSSEGPGNRMRDSLSFADQVGNQILGREIEPIDSSSLKAFAKIVSRQDNVQAYLAGLESSKPRAEEWKVRELRAAINDIQKEKAPREGKVFSHSVAKHVARANFREIARFAKEIEQHGAPHRLLAELSRRAGQPEDEWKSRELRQAIEAAAREPNARRLEAERRLNRQKALVRVVQFEFLGLKLAVDGLWAWTVWLVFLTVGVAYLWLERRICLIACEAASAPPVRRARIEARALPLWVRPIPQPSHWAVAVTSGRRTDAATDPLGAICAALLVVCAVLAIDAFRMAAVSSSLFERWPASDLARWSAATSGLAMLVLTAIGIQWIGPLFLRHHASPLRSSATGVSRRVWLSASLTAAVLGASHLSPALNRVVSRLLLNRPRFRTRSEVRRKRRIKTDEARLAPGFYTAPDGMTLCVPSDGRLKLLNAANKASSCPTAESSTLLPSVPCIRQHWCRLRVMELAACFADYSIGADPRTRRERMD